VLILAKDYCTENTQTKFDYYAVHQPV